MGYLDNDGLAHLWDKIKDYVSEHGGGDITSYIINAPVGAILAWSGTGDNIPTGWHVCNGEGGTLDLRDRFILGAGQNHAVGDTGGSEEVTLTIGQMPKHYHTYNAMGPSAQKVTVSSSGNSQAPYYTDYTTGTSGSSQPHPNMPPYYALLYIQKTGTTPEDYATEESVDTKIDALTQVKGIYTQSEFDALPEAEQRKGMYVISDSGGSSSEGDSGESLDVYSTEEQRIGTWINGKPLYRIVIKATTPAASSENTSTEVASYSANVEEVVRCNAIITSGTGQKTIAPYYYTNVDRAWVGYNPSNYTNVQFKNTVRMMVGTALVSKPTTIILEYTKTTDQPEVTA